MPHLVSALNYFNNILLPYIGSLEHVGLTFSIAVLVIAFAECFAILGYIMPGMIILYGAAAFALKQNLIPSYMICMAVGAFLADIASYHLGKKGHVIITRHREKRKEMFEKVHAFFNKYGVLGIIIGKNIGVIRPIIALTAGTSEMNFRTFAISTWIASIIWPLQYLATVYFFKKYGLRIGIFIHRFWLLMLGLVIMYFVVRWLLQLLRARASRARKE